jgi:hypothetical protein
MIKTRDERIAEAHKKISEIEDEFLEAEQKYLPLKQKMDELSSELKFAESFKNIGDMVSWTTQEGNHGRDTVHHTAWITGFVEQVNGVRARGSPYYECVCKSGEKTMVFTWQLDRK